jgi:hypothetical protein
MPKKRGRPTQEIDPEMVRNLAMIGATIQTIAEYVGCSRDTIENRFRPEIEEGRSNGQVRALGKVFQAAMNGQMRALELYLINQCGWTLKPETVVNVVSASSVVDNRSPEQIKAHLVEMQRAVLEEARRQLPPQSAE